MENEWETDTFLSKQCMFFVIISYQIQPSCVELQIGLYNILNTIYQAEKIEMGNCNNDRKEISEKLFKGIHHHKASPAYPKKVSDNGQENDTTSPSLLPKGQKDKQKGIQQDQKQQIKVPNLEKRKTEDTIKQSIPENGQKESESQYLSQEEDDIDDFDLRGTVVQSVNFEKELKQAKRKAVEMGELEPSSPRIERKWRRQVAGLSIVSEASAMKESSQYMSQRLSKSKNSTTHS